MLAVLPKTLTVIILYGSLTTSLHSCDHYLPPQRRELKFKNMSMFQKAQEWQSEDLNPGKVTKKSHTLTDFSDMEL